MCAVNCCAVCKRITVAASADGGTPYEEHVPMYADVDVLRRGSFSELYVYL